MASEEVTFERDSMATNVSPPRVKPLASIHTQSYWLTRASARKVSIYQSPFAIYHSLMKAAIIVTHGGVEGLEIREIDTPPMPTADRVRVRVRAAGLNRADAVGDDPSVFVTAVRE